MAKATHTQEPAKQEEAVQAPAGYVIVKGTGKKDKYKADKAYTMNEATAETLIAKGHVKK
jgi:hypothetical protein